MKIETLRWVDNKLEMVDQRILPASFQYLAYDSAASVAEGIRSMVVRGAPAIGVAAAYGVALEALRQVQGERCSGQPQCLQRHPISRRHTDGGRAAHHHAADAFCHRGSGVVGEILE